LTFAIVTTQVENMVFLSLFPFDFSFPACPSRVLLEKSGQAGSGAKAEIPFLWRQESKILTL